MEDFSDDRIVGGLYEDISKDASNNSREEEVEQWLFAPERRYGDAEIIRTESEGYHIVFFTGFGDRYCDFLADMSLREMQHKAWVESLAPVDAVRRWAFVLVQL
jgi:hypothetical protein